MNLYLKKDIFSVKFFILSSAFDLDNMIEKDNIRKWKRILIFFEQIGFLEDTEVHVLSDAYKALESFIQNEVLGFKMDEPESLLTEEDIAILNECSQSLHNWYSDISWKELKCTDYQLNWEILLSVLERHNIESVKHWFITELGHEKTERLHPYWK